MGVEHEHEHAITARLLVPSTRVSLGMLEAMQPNPMRARLVYAFPDLSSLHHRRLRVVVVRAPSFKWPFFRHILFAENLSSD
jgi:hypothetical protein